jgi:hypothetical protein
MALEFLGLADHLVVPSVTIGFLKANQRHAGLVVGHTAAVWVEASIILQKAQQVAESLRLPMIP